MTTKITFQLPSESVANASAGVLLGEFNDWNPAEGVQLLKNQDGSMYAELALTAGQSYQYRYLLNDGRWVNDNNLTTWSDVYGQPVENCVVVVPATEKKKVASKPVIPVEVIAKDVAAVKEVTSKKAAAPKTVAAVKKVATIKAEVVSNKVTAPKKAVAIKKVSAIKNK